MPGERDAVRVTATITKQQDRALRTLASRNKVSVAWLIRHAIDRLLSEGESVQLPLDLEDHAIGLSGACGIRTSERSLPRAPLHAWTCSAAPGGFSEGFRQAGFIQLRRRTLIRGQEEPSPLIMRVTEPN